MAQDRRRLQGLRRVPEADRPRYPSRHLRAARRLTTVGLGRWIEGCFTRLPRRALSSWKCVLTRKSVLVPVTDGEGVASSLDWHQLPQNFGILCPNCVPDGSPRRRRIAMSSWSRSTYACNSVLKCSSGDGGPTASLHNAGIDISEELKDQLEAGCEQVLNDPGCRPSAAHGVMALGKW